MGTVMKMGYSINNHLNRLMTAPITKQPPRIIDLQGLALALSRPMPASDSLYLRLKKDYFNWRRKETDTLISLLKSVKRSK